MRTAFFIKGEIGYLDAALIFVNDQRLRLVRLLLIFTTNSGTAECNCLHQTCPKKKIGQ